MDLINRDSVEVFVTKDTSIIREILAPRNSAIQKQSLAEATLPPGGTTQAHYHPITEEIYYILAGQGVMRMALPQNQGLGLDSSRPHSGPPLAPQNQRAGEDAPNASGALHQGEDAAPESASPQSPEERTVGPGDGIAIPPGAIHQIRNIGAGDLVFLCCCAPAYEHADTVLVESLFDGPLPSDPSQP